ncbi:hypothetical protein D8674_016900 [Pyrus ussuriensis x Pyrus communis]|uniref:Uncharacterized protein n=1 Tax=Pyrus ussuriensis x Pyrus communis TaxID=2448454 RepID=A0A5N5HIB6_9ROSA|nr:hypothetical protein D8674_016900 [Pyrus ussuriensis x Pyrus communis]
MATPAMKGRVWTRKEDETLCTTYRSVSEDSVKGSSQTSEGVWTYPPQERFGPMPMFRNVSSNAVGDEQGSPGKAKEDLAFREAMASLLRLMAEQNAIAAEERKQEMDDRNMQKNTSEYTPMSKAYFNRKKGEIMARQELFTSDYTPTMADEDDAYGL